MSPDNKLAERVEALPPGQRAESHLRTVLDDAVMLDLNGRVVSRSRQKWERRRLEFFITIMPIQAGSFVLMKLGSPIGGAITFVATFVLIRKQRRSSAGLEGVSRLVAGGDLEGADRELQTLEASRFSKPARWRSHELRGQIRWMQGDLDGALLEFERLQSSTRRKRIRRACAPTLAILYAVHGRIDEARLIRTQLVTKSNLLIFVLERTRVDLHIAFHAGDSAELPAIDELREIAMLALSRCLHSDLLVLLAWAFDEAGFSDLAANLLRQGLAKETLSWSIQLPAVETWIGSREGVLIDPRTTERGM